MPLPLVMLVGKAGVGKDTAANILATRFGAVVIAQADPLKRFAMAVLGMTPDQLWGPSSSRNAPDPRSKEEFIARWDGPEFLGAKINWLNVVGLSLPLHYDKLNWWFSTFVLGELDKKGFATPRHVLQTLGTEFGRAINPDIWVDYAQSRAIYALANNQRYSKESGLDAKSPQEPVTQMAVISDGRFANEIIATKRNNGVVIRLTGPDERLDGVAGQHASETEMDRIPDSWYDAIVYNDKTSLNELYGRMMTAMFHTLGIQ